jgi:hypothetical protein
MTLASLLGVTAPDIGPYQPGTEPTTSRRRSLQRRRRADLTPWTAHAAAGVPDSVIAAEAGVSASAVRAWRLRSGLSRRAMRERLDALAVALPTFRDVAVPTKSPVDGAWTPPRYVVRVALDYTAFCRAVCALLDAGWEVVEVATALGVRAIDAEHAAALGRARL